MRLSSGGEGALRLWAAQRVGGVHPPGLREHRLASMHAVRGFAVECGAYHANLVDPRVLEARSRGKEELCGLVEEHEVVVAGWADQGRPEEHVQAYSLEAQPLAGLVVPGFDWG